uniref:Uncharacterized LOC111647034 n=1 Tax=Seriola lalandi dorsalis TaxID=1841481 RepID=A0A3B4YQP8_SERLL
MTPPVFALYATCLLCLGRIADTTASKLSSSLHFVSVNVGEKVTLECFYKESATAVMFYWYKQTLGEKPRLVSKFYKHEKNGILQDDFKNNSRFELESTTGKNHLKISDVQMSDSATYYCVSSFSYVYEFLESITVTVKGSGLNNQSWIRQSAFEILQPGGSVTLNCTVHTGTCDGEHSVYWFKDSKESHPGLIYTHGDRNDQCERKPETQTQTCVYNLPMQRLNRSHAGTYYCAVASCGHILSDYNLKVKSVVLVYLLSGALAFNAVLVVVLAYIMYKANSCQCTDSQARSAAARAPNADELHYAALREHKASSSRRQRDDTMSECVYSSVKQ